MTSVYCEMKCDIVHTSKYIYFPDMKTEAYVNNAEYLQRISSRIWIDLGTHVRLVHNIHGDTDWTDVDMKEFMWVKLKSRQV